MPKQKRKPKITPQSDRIGNDILEWAIICSAGLGVGGGIFALIYLAHINGAL